MGVLIFFGIIILCIGIYYKFNNLNLKKKENNLIIQKPQNLTLENYYINNDKLIIDYTEKKKIIIHIYDIETGSLQKIIELLK